MLTSLDASVQLDGSKRDTVIEPESTALTLISNDATHAAPLAKQAAPSTVLPASVQLPTAVTANDDVTRAVSLTNNLDAKAVITHNASVGKANTGNAIDAEDEEEDETTDAKSSSPKPTEVIPFAHSLKTITIVLAPNLLDPTQPGLSYAVHAGTVFMQVGVSSLDMFGPLPPLVQAMLNEAERQWDTLIATQVAREAAAVEAKAAAQAETQQKAMEAKAAKAAAKKKPARKNGTHLNAAPSSSASVARSTTVALPAVTDEEEDDSGDPAEVTLTPVSTAMKETTQDSLFG